VTAGNPRIYVNARRTRRKKVRRELGTSDPLSLRRLGTSMGGSGTDWKRSLGLSFLWDCASCRLFSPVFLAVIAEELGACVYITNGFDGTTLVIFNILRFSGVSIIINKSHV